jgi:hypothetical protein
MNEPRPRGLPPKVQNLVILAFAAQADRSLVRNGAPAQASIDRIDDSVELREEALPDEAAWTKARERASALFGLVSGEVRKGATMARLAADLKAKAGEKRTPLAELMRELKPWAEALRIQATAPRIATIISAQALLSKLAGAASPLATVEVLAGATLETSEAAMSGFIAAVEDLRAALSAAPRDMIVTALTLGDHRRTAAEGLRDKLAEALEEDEHVIALKPVLQDVQTRAARLLAETRPSGEAPPQHPRPPEAPQPPPPSLDEEIVDERPQMVLNAAEAALALDTLWQRLKTEPAAKLTISWRLTRPKQGGHG